MTDSKEKVMNDISKHIIQESQTIREALEKLNTLPQSLTLFVLNEKSQMVGTLTDGDIRRNLLQNKSIDDTVGNFMFKDFRCLRQGAYGLDDIKKFKAKNLKQIPLLDADSKIIRIIDLNKIKSLLPVDAVVMAGGRGERLKPLTDNTPKPLLKVGSKSIIDYNIDRLNEYGVSNIFVTIKYLADQVVAHLNNGSERETKIHFVREAEPLGTIGSVSLIKEFTHDYILVMNSDLLTNIDFEDFFRNFIDEKADMAVASVPYHVVVPYAVLEKEQNRILSFKEKPTYTYYSNAGIYLIRKELLKLIPVEKQYNATDFMDMLIAKGYKLVQFPILGYWLDIGKHEDYEKAQKDVAHIKF